MKRPSSEQCTACADLTADSEAAFACWHPQWGGYHGACVVTFDNYDDGGKSGLFRCFTTDVWHDGDFPNDHPNPSNSFHYCAPSQLVDFGLLIMEKQLEASVDARKELEGLEALRARLDAVIAAVKP